MVLATGYKTMVPYLSESIFRWKGNRPNLHPRLFCQDQPGLAAIGFTEGDGGAGDGGAHELFDNMSDLIAHNAATPPNTTALNLRCCRPVSLVLIPMCPAE